MHALARQLPALAGTAERRMAGSLGFRPKARSGGSCRLDQSERSADFVYPQAGRDGHARSSAGGNDRQRCTGRYRRRRPLRSRQPISRARRCLSACLCHRGARTMKISFAEGLARAIYESLSAEPRVVLVGSGFMALNPAARAMLEPTLKDFSDRIHVTPISELALAGAGIGAAMAGLRPVVDLLTGRFLFPAFPPA